MAVYAGGARCGHTDPVNGCECGARVTAWWAETRRRLAEASPSLRAVFGGQNAAQIQNSAACDQRPGDAAPADISPHRRSGSAADQDPILAIRPFRAQC